MRYKTGILLRVFALLGCMVTLNSFATFSGDPGTQDSCFGVSDTEDSVALVMQRAALAMQIVNPFQTNNQSLGCGVKQLIAFVAGLAGGYGSHALFTAKLKKNASNDFKLGAEVASGFAAVTESVLLVPFFAVAAYQSLVHNKYESVFYALAGSLLSIGGLGLSEGYLHWEF